jgi:polysaccharide biosynthesis/export protein
MKQSLLLSLTVIIIAASSCVSVKPVQYMQGNTDTLPKDIIYTKPVIQAGDMLSIVIMSDNPAASSIYNQSSGAAALSNGSPGTQTFSVPSASQSGYLVNSEGNIIMPGIGVVKAAGFTKEQFADTLVNYFVKNDLLKNPSCDVRFLNYRVSVLGEVARPGVYIVPVEKVSILEALGLAGDVTVWAKRENVTVIREKPGGREFGRLDLNSTDIFKSPYYYLQQNDVVIVGQSKRKINANDQTTLRYVAISTSVLSTIAILINLFK